MHNRTPILYPSERAPDIQIQSLIPTSHYSNIPLGEHPLEDVQVEVHKSKYLKLLNLGARGKQPARLEHAGKTPTEGRVRDFAEPRRELLRG